MARIEVPMPQMGESIAEGTVSTWLKKVGDTVARDEPIMEISTDKVDAEIPSPAAGTLAEIVVKEGETVEVGTVVAFIETESGAAAAVPEPEAGAPAPNGDPRTPAVAAPAEPAAPTEPAAAAPPPTATGDLPGQPQPEPQVEAEAVAAGEAALEERIRTRSSPLVRRMAEEHDIDLSTVEGSGRMGRVTKDDMLARIQNGGAAGRATPTTGQVKVEAGANDRVEPMSRMTKLIAEHMVLSKQTSPHVHSFMEVDYSRIDRVRAGQKTLWADQGVKVSYTAFIVRAVATALREHPRINASISGSDVIYRGEVNIGVAVALPWGLIVPVIRKADELSLVGIAKAMNDLAERARAKRLSPEEVQGGTFTVTNPGIFGTVIGFPIINQPQVAILCVGGIEKRAVVIEDEFGNDAIVPRKRGYISLGFDHRLVNGADGDAFLARVKELMEAAGE